MNDTVIFLLNHRRIRLVSSLLCLRRGHFPLRRLSLHRPSRLVLLVLVLLFALILNLFCEKRSGRGCVDGQRRADVHIFRSFRAISCLVFWLFFLNHSRIRLVGSLLCLRRGQFFLRRLSFHHPLRLVFLVLVLLFALILNPFCRKRSGRGCVDGQRRVDGQSILIFRAISYLVFLLLLPSSGVSALYSAPLMHNQALIPATCNRLDFDGGHVEVGYCLCLICLICCHLCLCLMCLNCCHLLSCLILTLQLSLSLCLCLFIDLFVLVV
mmetsp:Transcript_80078/g.117316  ORF Transcript_80078/g.117316 Transcript_80078/m.117316 type:complete len:268 (+) Transcript_80078:131-934(+)